MLSKIILSKIIVIGGSPHSGIYLLRFALLCPAAVRFGRFEDGRAISIPAGECIYIGSARTQTRGPVLLRRVIRHATRSDDRPPHHLRNSLLAAGVCYGYQPNQFCPINPKRLHWHIDYLMDLPQTELRQVYLMNEPRFSEHCLADWLLDQSVTYQLAAGLGASDHPGSAHILGIRACPEWWRDLPDVLRSLVLWGR